MTDVSCYLKKQFMSIAKKMFREGVRVRTWVEIRIKDVTINNVSKRLNEE